jgi:multidrug resistance efflux pump
LTITAPANATIEALDLQPGDLVAAGAPVLSLVDHTRLWVRAYVPENRLNFQIGHKTVVTLDSFPGVRFPAEVTYIARQGEFTPSNVQTPEERTKQVFRIKVTITERAKDLRPGMIADVWLEPPPAAPAKPSAAPSKPAAASTGATTAN